MCSFPLSVPAKNGEKPYFLDIISQPKFYHISTEKTRFFCGKNTGIWDSKIGENAIFFMNIGWFNRVLMKKKKEDTNPYIFSIYFLSEIKKFVDLLP